MQTSSVYCDLCATDVHVTLTPMPLHEGEPTLPDAPELVCLTFGARCAAGRCPVSGLPSVVMGVRLARSGLPAEEGWRRLRMHCHGCEQVAEMEILDNVHAYCPQCGTTNRWFRLEMGEHAVAVAVAPAD